MCVVKVLTVFLYHFAIDVFLHMCFELAGPQEIYETSNITVATCVFSMAYLQRETKRKASSANPTKVARAERIQ